LALLAHDLVRSLPMDIVPPYHSIAEERRPWSILSRRSRSREKEIAPTRSHSPTAKDGPRLHSRSRSRSRSRGSASRSRNSSAGIKVAPVNSGVREWSHGEAAHEVGEPRRGRNRVCKALGSPKDRSLWDLRGEGESGRGSERVTAEVRGGEEERGSASRGAGRDRTARAI
jgi:hypothetical protein